MKRNILWDITPCSLLKVNGPFEEHVNSETSVQRQQTARRYIAEDGSLQNNRCKYVGQGSRKINFSKTLSSFSFRSADVPKSRNKWGTRARTPHPLTANISDFCHILKAVHTYINFLGGKYNYLLMVHSLRTEF
jgi:hypothetical protein